MNPDLVLTWTRFAFVSHLWYPYRGRRIVGAADLDESEPLNVPSSVELKEGLRWQESK